MRTHDGGAKIQRYAAALPLSREAHHYRRLGRAVDAYRSFLGQPRQDGRLSCVGQEFHWLHLDLTPPDRSAAPAAARRVAPGEVGGSCD